jgi:hypothetical protein
LELLAIVKAFEEWRAWLMGTVNPVKVFSDHSNLFYFKTAKYLSPKQAQWDSFLDNFNMQIHHIPGKRNTADGPSRREDFAAGDQQLSSSHTISDKMVTNNAISLNIHDLQFQRPNQVLLNQFWTCYSAADCVVKGIVKDGNLLWHRDQIFIPTALRTKLLRIYHDSPAVGHPGIARTLSTLLRTFSWPQVKESVIKYV